MKKLLFIFSKITLSIENYQSIENIKFCCRFLNNIATLTASKNAGDLWKFLGDVYETTIPVSGASVSILLPDSKTVSLFLLTYDI